MTDIQSGYDVLARYYDLMHRQLRADLPLILSLAAAAGGEILEVGCGTGRVLISLAKEGIKGTGIDNSPAMIARAQSHLADQPKEVQARMTLIRADASNLQLPSQSGKFNLALVAYNTLLHFDPRESLQLLVGLRSLMRDRGEFFADLLNPFTLDSLDEDGSFYQEDILYEQLSAKQTVVLSAATHDPAKQTITVQWRFEEGTPAAVDDLVSNAQLAYHYLYPHQIEILLRRAGFDLISLWGDYDRSPFTQESRRLLVLARKKG